MEKEELGMTDRFDIFRKSIAIFTIFCLLLMLSMPISIMATTPADISNHWAKTTIQSWLDKAFIAGYPDGSFKPNNNITRAEFMALVNKAFGYTETASITFSDVDTDAWYGSAVAIAIAAGYINGYPDGTMRPNSPVSREEAAAIIMKIINLKADANYAVKFTDVAKLTWSKGSVGAVAKAGIMNGYPDGRFDPKLMIKRGECIVSLDRAIAFEKSEQVPVSAIMVTPTSMSLTAGGATGTLTETVTPVNATNKAVIWSSSNVAVAIVTNGVVTPLTVGTATITATTIEGSLTATSLITVVPVVPVVPVDPVVTLESISITTPATKLIYTIGATLDITGMVVTGTYSDASTQSMSISAANVTGFDSSVAVASQTLTVTVGAKTTTYTVKINVVDTTAPVLQLIGANPASTNLVLFPTLVFGDNGYVDPGAIAIDNLDGNISDLIVVTGTAVNTKAVGSYDLTYTVTDAAGNETSVMRTVNVVAKMDPTSITKFTTQLLIPWAMPKSVDPNPVAGTDYYEIAMRQFDQQMLPEPLPKTTVWGYGSATEENAVFNAPSLSIEVASNTKTRIKWINDLIDSNGNYLPHLLPVDQTLHWANPSAGSMGRDMAGTSQIAYVGPVPIVTHVHGAHVNQESDGYPEAWYLPNANGIPASYAKTGTFYDIYKNTAASGANWSLGNAVFDYENDQRDNTLWYHDHAMGMTRTNVYTGPAGFYLIRGNSADTVYNSAAAPGTPAILPGPAPIAAPTSSELAGGKIYEIPLALQDRSFNTDGSLYYPDSRVFFDGFAGPYTPDVTSDIAPLWNPEFFGDTIIVNGNTWPFQNVEPKRYRLRFLNGSQARTFILQLNNRTEASSTGGLDFTQIGSDGGFLASPASLSELVIGPAERADVIVDFTGIAPGTVYHLENFGPDGPYKGGTPDYGNLGAGFVSADPATTGKVMAFRVIEDLSNTPDPSTPVDNLDLPTVTPLVSDVPTRQVSLNEEMSMLLADEGPKAALLGTVSKDPITGLVIAGIPQMWSDPITEGVLYNSTEIWEIYNFTEDAHPIHLHLVEFQVLDRQDFNPITGALIGSPTPANSWESGYKDTLLAYPGQVTRIIAKFDKVGRYVWHCHILEHEDNEMMRPFLVQQ